MAGHGRFVWSAYGISALVLAASVLHPLLRYRSEIKRLQRRATAQQVAQQVAQQAGQR
ncbi:MAG: heme exporter protein CcmD [Gammaproteobacteria bacterium]|nr:heme exporter protein CcmD [Gammaproteobacteria bacterium]